MHSMFDYNEEYRSERCMRVVIRADACQARARRVDLTSRYSVLGSDITIEAGK